MTLFVGVTISTLVSAAFTLIGIVAFVVFYFSCRCKHDNFDLMMLAQSVGAGDANDEGFGFDDVQAINDEER